MPDKPVSYPTFSEALRFWLKLGFISFGGPTGQIAIMHEELVEKRKWISEGRFLHALNFCMLLPGPEATQLATYVGWLLHKTRGGIAAGVLFVLPSVFLLWALSFIYVKFGDVAWVNSVFYGLKPAVVAIVAAAVLRIGSRALKNMTMWTIALIAFLAISVLKIPFPLIIFTAAAIGLIGAKLFPRTFVVSTTPDVVPAPDQTPVISDVEISAAVRPSWRRTFQVLAVCLALWWTPVWLTGWALGWNHALFREGIFFSQAAMTTFGGAYAVLPYVSQHAMNAGWLSAGQMLDGLGLAETTPGPLIMVLQFVGFLGGWQHPGNLPPLLAATLGALITTWTTFVPCFLWIFLGAPHIEQLRKNVKLTSALATVTAAVVGVVLNLAVWFGSHVLFPPADHGRRLDVFALALAAIAFVGLWRWKWSLIPVIAGAGILGVVHQFVF
ncbi:MAG TPA: chromate efflux transporter [Verrucomicrobiae bacterium]